MSQQEPNLGGRPRIELTDEDFAKLIAMIRIQCTQEEICGVLGMSPDTLARRLDERGEPGFAELYEKHSSEGKASLRRMQWKAADGGNITMLIWLGKQMLGQRDKVETTGRDGGPIESRVRLDVSKLSDSTLDELMQAMPGDAADA